MKKLLILFLLIPFLTKGQSLSREDLQYNIRVLGTVPGRYINPGSITFDKLAPSLIQSLTALSGGGIITTNASSLTTGTISDARLSPNIATTALVGTLISNATSPISTSLLNKNDQINIINVTQKGVIPNTGVNQSNNIQSLVANNTTLHFPSGVYTLTNFITVSGISNFKIILDFGATITTNITKAFLFNGTLKNIDIGGYGLITSTRNSTTEDPEGTISVLEYGTGTLDNFYIHDIEMSNPNSNSNAIKFVWETSNGAKARNILLERINFHDIGRMCSEFQDHVNDSFTPRISNIGVNYCKSYLTGKYQYGELVSFTNGARDCIASFNTITDVMGVTGSGANGQRCGIELAGSNQQAISNQIKSENYFFLGILSSGSDNKILSNDIQLTGGTDKTVVRGIYIYNGQSNINVIGNDIRTDGNAIFLDNVANCIITANRAFVKDDNVMIIQNGATKNLITSNVFSQTSTAVNGGTIKFSGATTTLNYTYLNQLTNPSGGAGDVSQANSATNNMRAALSTEATRFYANNFQEAAVFATAGGGEIRIGQNGRTIGSYTTSSGASANMDLLAPLVNIGTALQVGTTATISGVATAKHFKGGTSAPTIAAGAGMGTSPTAVSVTGNDSGGFINFTTGTSPTTGVIATITFNQAFTTNAPVVLTDGINDGARVNYTLWRVGTRSTTTFQIVNTASNTLAASTPFIISYKTEEQ